MSPVIRIRETQSRESAIRRLRVAIWRGEISLVRHVRWPALGWMLEDLAATLAVGPKPVALVNLPIAGGLRGPEGQRILPYAVAEALRVPVTHSMMAAEREGVRAQLRTIFCEASTGPRTALVLSDADGLNFETLQDLCFAWRDASIQVGHVAEKQMPALVIMRRVGCASLVLDEAQRITIGDPTREEAKWMLAGLLGGSDERRLEAIVDTVGTVPGFLLRSAAMGGVTGPRDVRDALGWMWRELVHAVGIVRSQEVLANRLDALAVQDLPTVPKIDRQLRRAGLVAFDDQRKYPVTRLRSPLIRFVAAVDTML